MIWQIFNVIAPVFLLSGAGYLWYRRAQPFDTATIGGLVMTIGSPCLVFSSLTAIDVDARAFADIAIISGLATVTMLGFGWLGLRATGSPIRAYLPTLFQPNSGNMGLPLCLMAFGETGLALAVAYYVVNAVFQYTLGMAVASGTASPARLLKQPVLWAVLIALTVKHTSVPVPAFIAGTTELMGGFVIPAMLLMLGTSLAKLHLSHLRTTIAVAAARLLGGFAVGWLLIWAFELQGIAAGVVIIQSAMPSAVFNIVFAEQFDNEPESVAAVILLSTVVSFATLPLLTAFAINLAA